MKHETMTTPRRPTPNGVTGKGRPAYSGADLAAYRQYFGISQSDLARRIGSTVSAVAKSEQRDVITEKVALRHMSAVDYLWRLRQEIRRSGIVAMQAMRDPSDDATLTVERVLDRITDEPLTIPAIVERSGVEADDVIQALADLFLAGHIERVPEGYVRAEHAAIVRAAR